MSTDWLRRARVDVVGNVLLDWIGDGPAEQRHMVDSYSKRLDIADTIVTALEAMDQALPPIAPVTGLHIELREIDGFWLVMLDEQRMYAAQSRFTEAYKFFEEARDHREEMGLS